jgi:hypothetical protein
MACIGIEGWDHYRNGDFSPFDNGQVPPSVVTGSSTRLNYGQAAVGSGTTLFRWTVNHATIIQGVAYWISNTTGSEDVFVLYEGGTSSGNIQVHCLIDRANRQIHVYRGSGTTNLLGSSAVNDIPPSSTHFYVEWKVVVHNTTGSVMVKIDGTTTIINLSGVNTRNTANANVTSADVIAAGSGCRIDDYYCFDGSGSRFNDFFGNARVRTEYPTGDNSIQSTPSTGTDAYAMVDDPGDVDGDTTYTAFSAAGKDLYNITGGVPVGATMGPVELRTTFRKDDAGTCTGRGLIKSSATESAGTTRNPGTTYAQFRDVYELDPNGSVAWTPSGYNAIKIGVERQT